MRRAGLRMPDRHVHEPLPAFGERGWPERTPQCCMVEGLAADEERILCRARRGSAYHELPAGRAREFVEELRDRLDVASVLVGVPGQSQVEAEIPIDEVACTHPGLASVTLIDEVRGVAGPFVLVDETLDLLPEEMLHVVQVGTVDVRVQDLIGSHGLVCPTIRRSAASSRV